MVSSKRSGGEAIAADVAKKSAGNVFKDKNAFASKNAFVDALAKALEGTRKMTKEKARALAEKVETGFAFFGAKSPLKTPGAGPKMEIDALREKLTESAIDAFYPIFGEAKARDKARDFVVLLLGDAGFKRPGPKKKSLLEQITEQIQALMVVMKGKMDPDMAQELIKSTIIQSVSENAKCDLDSFILNEALSGPGKKLLSTMHEAMVGKGKGEKGLNIPLQI